MVHLLKSTTKTNYGDVEWQLQQVMTLNNLQ